MITAGEGKYKVWLKKEELGRDLIYMLGGGEKSHVGSVVVKYPDREAEVLKLANHYDHIVLEPIAEAASKKYGRKVVALGGVHVENASKEEIDILVQNCRELLKCI